MFLRFEKVQPYSLLGVQFNLEWKRQKSFIFQSFFFLLLLQVLPSPFIFQSLIQKEE